MHHFFFIHILFYFFEKSHSNSATKTWFMGNSIEIWPPTVIWCDNNNHIWMVVGVKFQFLPLRCGRRRPCGSYVLNIRIFYALSGFFFFFFSFLWFSSFHYFQNSICSRATKSAGVMPDTTTVDIVLYSYILLCQLLTPPAHYNTSNIY